VVWVLGADGALASRRVVLGPSDGKNTAVLQGELAEGDQVVTGGGPTGAGQGASSPRFGRFL
jgi:multidrug efflux pump subunit AcrA (membrane-fusion protein)